MQEFTLGETKRAPIVLDPAIVDELRKTRTAIEARSLLNWAEHCSECAMPECYATCSLFTPRPDLKCRRFDRGIEGKFVGGSSESIPLMSLTFRRWGKLEAKGGVNILPGATAAFLESCEPAMARLFDNPLLPLSTRRRALRAGDMAKDAVVRAFGHDDRPDLFLIEVVNRGETPLGLTLTVKALDPGVPGLFQGHFEVAGGYNRIFFPAADIRNRLSGEGPFLYQIEPITVTADTPALLFGVVDFIGLKPGSDLPRRPALEGDMARATAHEPGAARPKVKCVVWDLDNTLWSGTLVEDGPEGVGLDPRAAALIVELDRRGILNSIASKNSADAVQPLLERFGLAEYFLYQQIHWDPKSRSVAAIAKALNIGIDSLVLIDDQAFERGEVQHAHPSVEVFDVDILDSMLDHTRFDVPVTEEGQNRRAMYKVEQTRLAILEETGGDYAAFLRGCSIKLVVKELDDGDMKRAFELTERTNQLNYSGRRMSRAELDAKVADPDFRILVLSVSDKFGDYGVIGVAVLDVRSWTVESFFMSCRVQRKTVENAFFGHLMDIGRRLGKSRLSIVYKPTAKNQPSREVLQDGMSFRAVEADGGVLFQLETSEVVSDSDIVAIEDRTQLFDLQSSVLEHA